MRKRGGPVPEFVGLSPRDERLRRSPRDNHRLNFVTNITGAVFIDANRASPELGRKVHGKPLVYLDGAPMSQKLLAIIDSMVKLYTGNTPGPKRATRSATSSSSRSDVTQPNPISPEWIDLYFTRARMCVVDSLLKCHSRTSRIIFRGKR